VVEQIVSRQVPAIAIIQRKHFTGAPQVEEKLLLQSAAVKGKGIALGHGPVRNLHALVIGRQLWPKLLLSGISTQNPPADISGNPPIPTDNAIVRERQPSVAFYGVLGLLFSRSGSLLCGNRVAFDRVRQPHDLVNRARAKCVRQIAGFKEMQPRTSVFLDRLSIFGIGFPQSKKPSVSHGGD